MKYDNITYCRSTRGGGNHHILEYWCTGIGVRQLVKIKYFDIATSEIIISKHRVFKMK